MPSLSKSDEINILKHVLNCTTQPKGWHAFLNLIDSSLNCRSFLTEFDKNADPTEKLGGYRSANELSRILQRIETTGGRNALQFLLSEAVLYHPYCKTFLEWGNVVVSSSAEDQTAERSASRSPAELELSRDGCQTRLHHSPGLISPVWQSGKSRVLFACLFPAHTPATINVSAASEAFRKIVQALTPALSAYFELEKKRHDNHIQQILLSGLNSSAVLITADRQILGQTSDGIEVLVKTGIALVRGKKLVFKNKQVNEVFQVLQSSGKKQHAGSRPENEDMACSNAKSTCVVSRDGSLKRISIETVPHLPSKTGTSTTARYMIRVSETTKLPEEIECVLQDHYDLSQSEARLARQLTITGSMHSTADSLGITRNTAKTHLRRIYEKTGAHTQLKLASLVHKLAGLF